MKVKFPIGDWSGDGHSQCEWFVVKVNDQGSDERTLQALREAHFKCNDVLGFEIGDICSRYNDSVIKDDIIEIISKKIWKEDMKIGDEEIEELKACYKNVSVRSDELLNLWLEILNYIDKTLYLEVLEEGDLPTINFYGFDKQRRHLKTPGYGLF